jgi:dienelactone hydrolase
MRTWKDRREWSRYKFHLQRQILGAAGLTPTPRRTPLNVRTVRRNRYDGYCADALLIETMPGFRVGATVYYPVDTTQKRPAVLVPHGHWKHGRVENLPSYSVPAMGVNLALQGYVALTWDMLGFNDTRQLPHDFGGWREQLWGFNPLGVQLWNSMRMLDYLATRGDVDTKRIACTGASGGATQTILLSAVDSRVACSVPVNMVSSIYQGADPCEEAPNLRLGSNNVEIAALTAPRPMLLVSCTGDWTKNTPKIEFPAIQRTYALYNRTESVENAHFDADHNYDRRTRERVYQFLARHLLNRHDWKYSERELSDFHAEELLSTEENGTRSEQEDYDGLFAQWQAMCRRDLSEASSARVRLALSTALMSENPRLVGASGTGPRLLLNRTGKRDRVPVKWKEGRGAPAILVHPEGAEAAALTPEYRQLAASRRPVLAVDVFQTGLAYAPRERGGKWYLSYNQTDDAHRIQDILTSLAWIRSQTSATPELMGFGKAALWVVFAAAVWRYPVNVIADVQKWNGADDMLHDNCFVPCLQRAGGLDAALRVLRNVRPRL